MSSLGPACLDWGIRPGLIYAIASRRYVVHGRITKVGASAVTSQRKEGGEVRL